jgi:hypothetical protein
MFRRIRMPDRLHPVELSVMSNKPGRPNAAKRPPLTRTQLLPLSAATVRTVSLRNHLALLAMRNGYGSAEHISELIKTLYLAYFICDPNRFEPPVETYLAAEGILKAFIRDPVAPDAWHIDELRCKSIEAILCAHDTQLATTPLHRITEARRRLDHSLKKGCFPDLQAIHTPCR